jgi:hypothetical protein
LQPLVRSWKRYRARLFSDYARGTPVACETQISRLALFNRHHVNYWTEDGHDRTALLQGTIAALGERRWGNVIDSGWSDWDLEVHSHPWTTIRVCTTQEEHGSGKRLIRVRYHLRPSETSWTLGIVGLIGIGAVAAYHPVAGAILAGLLLVAALVAWRCGSQLGKQVMGVLETVARDMKMIRCQPQPTNPTRSRLKHLT